MTETLCLNCVKKIGIRYNKSRKKEIQRKESDSCKFCAYKKKLDLISGAWIMNFLYDMKRSAKQ